MILQEPFPIWKMPYLLHVFKIHAFLKGITSSLKSGVEPSSISKGGKENSPLCGKLISSNELNCFNNWMLYGSICWKVAERIHVNSIYVNSIYVNYCLYCYQLLAGILCLLIFM